MWTAIPKVLAALLIGVLSTAATAQTGPKKPNILVIWGDDIGINNISAYNLGVMGYQTPSIDRIAKEGALFTDAYAWQKLHGGPQLVHSRRASGQRRLPRALRFTGTIGQVAVRLGEEKITPAEQRQFDAIRGRAVMAE